MAYTLSSIMKIRRSRERKAKGRERGRRKKGESRDNWMLLCKTSITAFLQIQCHFDQLIRDVSSFPFLCRGRSFLCRDEFVNPFVDFFDFVIVSIRHQVHRRF